VVLGEEQLLVPPDLRVQGAQLLEERAALEELVLHPQRQRLAE
jgi:hypothetical protein